MKRLLSLVLIIGILLTMFGVPVFADDGETDYVKATLEGKRILFLGDSYTAGRGVEDYADTWCGRLESEYGMIVNCQSINGSTMGATDTFGYFPGCCFFPICLRPMPEEEFDVIFVSCGSNDWNVELPIGDDPESRDISTYMGAVNVLIDRAEEEHPEATLILMTPWMTDGRLTSRGETTDDYAYAMEQVCVLRQVACLNVVNPFVSGIFADNEYFRKDYFLTETDPWHLNEEGHDRFLPVAAAWIAKIMLADNIFDAGGGMNELRFIDDIIPLPWVPAFWFKNPK